MAHGIQMTGTLFFSGTSYGSYRKTNEEAKRKEVEGWHRRVRENKTSDKVRGATASGVEEPRQR
jgi:hypothetical protein